MVLTVIVFLTVLLVIIYLIDPVKENLRHSRLLFKLPGPKPRFLLGNIPDLICNEAELFKKIRQWSQEYSPVYLVVAGHELAANICGPDDFEFFGSFFAWGFKWNKRNKMFLIVSLLIGFLVLSYISRYVIRNISSLRILYKLPGPKAYPFVGHVFDLLCDQATMFRKLRKWGQEYYPVYNLFVGFYNVINITGPEDFEAIASTTKNIEKGLYYTFLTSWLGEGLLTSTGLKWQTRRKILTPAFHFTILQQFLEIFVNETDHLVKNLKDVCHKPYVNIIPYVSQCTLMAINETAMGVQLKLENDEAKSYCTAIKEMGQIFGRRLQSPWFYPKKIYYDFTSAGSEEKRLVKILHNFTDKIINRKVQQFKTCETIIDEDGNKFSYSKRKRAAMLDLLLNAKVNSGIIDDKGIKDEVNTFMFEGHDTTSMALCFAIMVLAQHKDVQETILREINSVLGNSNAQPTYNNLLELKFMERCIKECLRLYPSVPSIGRVLEEVVKTSNGYIIPKGSNVYVHIFDIHRNPKFWPNPEKFEPDRFLPENCKYRHPFSYVPFSAGPRNCIGQKFALLEMKVVLCGILRNFVLEPVDLPEEVDIGLDLVLRAKNNVLRLKFLPRNKF